MDIQINGLTGPDWVYQSFGKAKNAKKTAEIRVFETTEGVKFIPIEVLNDPSWDTKQKVKHPDTQESKPLSEWLTPVTVTMYEPE